MLGQKGFDDIGMNALSEVEKRIVRHSLGFAAYGYFFVDHIKAQMQVLGRELHAVHDPVRIEQRAAALSAKAGRAHLDAVHLVAIGEKAREHSVDRETRRGFDAFVDPLDFVRCFVICEVAEFGKREAEPAEVFARLNLVRVFFENRMPGVAQCPVVVEFEDS